MVILNSASLSGWFTHSCWISLRVSLGLISGFFVAFSLFGERVRWSTCGRCVRMLGCTTADSGARFRTGVLRVLPKGEASTLRIVILLINYITIDLKQISQRNLTDRGCPRQASWSTASSRRSSTYGYRWAADIPWDQQYN